MNQKKIWPCTYCGEAHTADGRKIAMHGVFDGAGDTAVRMSETVKLRVRNPHIWHGVKFEGFTILGQRFTWIFERKRERP